MRQGAFSLMELLVSIAIVAVLMGILVPALPLALQRAEDARCRSHLHSIAQAFHLYAAANRGSAPDVENSSVLENSSLPWHEQLRPYAPGEEIFRCPSDTRLSANEVGVSYDWRNSYYPQSGIRRLPTARSNAVLLFDMAGGWHRENFFNVSLVDTSAHSYSDLQWLDDLDRPVR